MALGGGFWRGWAFSHLIDFAISQAAAGKVDYAGLVEQNGSNYNMLGA